MSDVSCSDPKWREWREKAGRAAKSDMATRGPHKRAVQIPPPFSGQTGGVPGIKVEFPELQYQGK